MKIHIAALTSLIVAGIFIMWLANYIERTRAETLATKTELEGALAKKAGLKIEDCPYTRNNWFDPRESRLNWMKGFTNDSHN